jgi:hypothetical protein
MSIQTFLHLEALEHTKQGIVAYKGKLEELIKTDIEKAKLDLKIIIAHFESELARLRGLIDTRVLAHLDEGNAPQVAVQLAAVSAPTRAETAAKILAEQNGTVAV